MAERRAFAEAGVVAVTTAWFVWRAVHLDAWDRPLGSDWESYLRNVLAVGTDRWATFNVWRGPLHAWLTLAALPLCGTMIAASKTVSIVAVASAIPAIWALGRAMAVPGAVWGAVLFALWPDVEVVAHFSTMYPLLMAFLVGGAALVSTQTFAGALSGGVLFGLTGATDLRGLALAFAFVAAAALAQPTRAALARFAICAGAAALVAALLFARVPVALVGLDDQIATQALLAPMDDVLTENLRSLVGAGPHLVGVAFVCAPLALLRDTRRRLALAAPVVLLLASLPLVPLQFRYFLPVAPFVSLLAAAGIATVLRRAPWFVPGLVVLALCASRRLSDQSLLYALWHPGPGSIERASSGFAHPDEVVTAVERAQRRARFAQVVDCSTLGIVDILVYPRPLERPSNDACARIARAGMLGNRPTLFLTDDPGGTNPNVWRERAVVVAMGGASKTAAPFGVYESARADTGAE